MSNAKQGSRIVLRIDGYYLYSVGASIHPLRDIVATAKFTDVLWPLLIADGALEPFINQSVYSIKTSRAAGLALLTTVRRLKEVAEDEANNSEEIGVYNIYELSSRLTAFETLVAAELGLSAIYLVLKKRGYDTTDLINYGALLFPGDLIVKVPNTKLDVEQGARCLAFELPTAAGFHFHRANESVLHKYYDAVTQGKPRPTGRNIGAFLAELNKYNVGDPLVKASLHL